MNSCDRMRKEPLGGKKSLFCFPSKILGHFWFTNALYSVKTDPPISMYTLFLKNWNEVQ